MVSVQTELRTFLLVLLILNGISALRMLPICGNRRGRSLHALKINPLVDNLSPSKIIEINGMIKEIEKAGEEVFSLCVGEPDYQPPDAVLQATCKAAMSGATKYTAVAGELALRQAISRDLTHRKHTPYTADEIVVANGAKQSVVQALLTVVSPGDTVLLPSPFWASYPDMVKLCQAETVMVPTTVDMGYRLTATALRQALQDNPCTSAIILCNPSNPTGRNTDRENIREIAMVLQEFPQVAVISDEIYERLVYDGDTHHSFAAVAPELFDRTITINGCSKSHAMTGYRIGYCAAATPIARQIAKLQSQMTSCASAISQAAALAALEDVSIVQSGWLEQRLKELQEKRDLAVKLLREIPNIDIPVPTGAFYLLPDVHHYYGKRHTFADGSTLLINNSHDLCVALLKSERVGMVPGESFGDDRCVRLSYATSLGVIEQALIRFKSFLLALR